MSSLDQDFVAQFNEKLKDIRDICSGKTESVMHMDTTLEEREVIDEQQIWNMFEEIKRQVIKLDITNGSLLDIGNPLGDIKDTKNPRRWFEGSYYICKKCNKKEYGDTMFRCHLKKDHQLTASDTRNLSAFCSHSEQLTIACQLCPMSLSHDYSTLSRHIKTQHFMSIVDYEANFVNGTKTLKESGSSPDLDDQLIPQLENVAPESQVRPKLRILSPTTINGKIEKSLLSADNIQAEPQTFVTDKPTSSVLRHGTEQISPEKTVQLRNKILAQTSHKAPCTPGLEITGEVNTPEQEVVAVKREPMEHVPRTRTLYYCPFKSVDNPAENCKYFTNKQGFTNNAASLHISEVHKLKAKDMKPGQCKFQKVKVEKE